MEGSEGWCWARAGYPRRSHARPGAAPVRSGGPWTQLAPTPALLRDLPPGERVKDGS